MIKTHALLSLFAIFCAASAGAATDPSWTIETFTRSANGNRGIASALDRDGRLHIAFTGCSDAKCAQDELYYGIRGTDGKWALGAVDSDQGHTGWSVSLALDDTENLHLFYSNHYKLPMLHHATRPFASKAEPGKDWKIEVATKLSSGYWTSAAFGRDGITVANTEFPTNNVNKSAFGVFTLDRSGVWSHEVVDSSFNAGWFTSTAIGADGLPLVLYVSGGYPNGDLNLARKLPDGKWKIEELDYQVVKSDLVVDAKGFLHIAYNKMDETYMKTRDLMYATNAPDGKWHKTLVEGGAYPQQDTGHFPAIKLDPQGGVHIVYDDDFHQKVVYARNLGDGWKIYPVTRNKQDGYYAAINIDDKGGIHLVYDTGFELKYAYCPDCAVH